MARLTWRQRVSSSPPLMDIKTWGEPSLSSMPLRVRKGYLRRRSIVVNVLAGTPIHEIGRSFGMSQAEIVRLMNRCLGGDDQEEPALARGLIPNAHTAGSVRRSELPVAGKESGSKNAFQALLNQVPGLRNHLDQLISADLKNRAYATNLSPGVIHGHFLHYLASRAWPSDTYPYTSASQAYESLRQYAARRRDTLLDEQQRKPRRAIQSREHPELAFSEVELDEHILNGTSTVYLNTGFKVVPVRIARLTIVMAVDVATYTILAYVFLLDRSANQYDVLRCLARVYQPWEPRVLKTPELEYLPGGALPCGPVFDPQQPPAIQMLRLDNALSHHANSVKHYVTETLGATLNFGIPATPKDRRWIEQAFSPLARKMEQFKSTTGHSVTDPKRETHKNARRPPRLTLQTLSELIDIHVTSHNAQPRAHLGTASPLQRLDNDLITQRIECFSTPQAQELRAPLFRKYVTVKRHSKHSGDMHVNFLYVTYTGAGLTTALTNERIEIRFDEQDIRHIQAYRLDGTYIGELRAPRSWQLFAHSVKTRVRIHAFLRKHPDRRHEPLIAYQAHLLAQRNKPAAALELVRLATEAESSMGTPTVHDEVQPDYSQSLVPIPDWTPASFGRNLK